MQIGTVNSEEPGRTKIIKHIISSPRCAARTVRAHARWEGAGLCLYPLSLYPSYCALLLQRSLADGAPALAGVEGKGNFLSRLLPIFLL